MAKMPEFEQEKRFLDFDLKGSDSNLSVNQASPGSSHSGGSVSSDSPDTKSKEKICVVCGDAATGTHFAAMTCEGCKGFFRRSMKKCSQFTCAFENQCTINKSNRKHCQACRLQKCLAVGMNSGLIMSDESVNRKRELIRANREKRLQLRIKKEQDEMEQTAKVTASPQHPVVELAVEDKELIKVLLDSHNASYDFSYEDYETFRGRQHISSPNMQEIKSSHLTLAWLMSSSVDSDSANPKDKGDRSKKGTGPREGKDAKLDPLKKVKSEPDKRCKQEATGPGDVSEMFSSLHGVSQELPEYASGEASSSSSHHQDSSYHSDTSGSISSPPTCMGAEAAHPFDLEAFRSSYPPFLDQQSEVGMDMMFDEMPNIGFDSMSYLQGLFMNQESGDGKTHSLFQHFCDIMTWGIKKVIEFCKCIPEFQDLSTVDQINLLRGGCLEMLVLRSYFAFASDGNNYMSDKFQYSPTDFLQAGASADFVEQYTKVHMRMRKMKLNVEEICLLIGLVLFSPDRPGIQDHEKVEAMQKRIAQALRGYEYTHKEPEKACVVYSELLLLLPVLRTINVYFSNTILTLKSSNEDDMNPLILEVNN